MSFSGKLEMKDPISGSVVFNSSFSTAIRHGHDSFNLAATAVEFQQAIHNVPILVVDDNRSSLRLLKSMLGRAGYRHVDATHCPLQAIEYYADIRHALVLLDILLAFGFSVSYCRMT